MKIGIFGGTFNPVHLGHLRAAEEISQDFLDKIIFVPSNTTSNKLHTPHNPDKRLKMLSLAIEGNDKFEVSDIEIKRGGITYSHETILFFKELFPFDDLYFIAGLDVYMDIKNWKKSENVLGMINFIIIDRGSDGINVRNIDELANYLPDRVRTETNMDYSNNSLIIRNSNSIKFIKTTKLDISSTKIRDNFRRNISNLYLLPKNVIDYIINNKIYF